MVTPYFSVCGPPELLAMLPPMVHACWLDGIGRVVVAAGADGPGQVQVDEPRLDDGDLVVVVDLEHAVHPHHRDDDAALGRQAAARQPGAGAARHEGQPLAVGEPDDGRHVLGRRREHDEVGQRPEQRQPVGFVDEQLVGLGQHRPGPEQTRQLPAQRGLAIGGERDHRVLEVYPLPTRRAGAAVASHPSSVEAAATMASASMP